MLTIYIIGVVLYGLYTLYAITVSETGGSIVVKLMSGAFLVGIWPIVLVLSLVGDWSTVRAERARTEEAMRSRFK